MERKLREVEGAPVTLHGMLCIIYSEWRPLELCGGEVAVRTHQGSWGEVLEWKDIKKGSAWDTTVGAPGLSLDPPDWGRGGVVGKGCEEDLPISHPARGWFQAKVCIKR